MKKYRNYFNCSCCEYNSAFDLSRFKHNYVNRSKWNYKNAISAKAQTNQSNMEEQLKLIVANEKINSYTNTTSEDNLEKELNNMGYNTLTIKWQNYIIFDLDTNDEYRITENGQIENMGQTDLGKN